MFRLDVQTLFTLAIVLTATLFLLRKLWGQRTQKNCGDGCSNCGVCASTSLSAITNLAVPITLRDANPPPKITVG